MIDSCQGNRNCLLFITEPAACISELSLQTLVVISLHFSALMYSATMLASFVKVNVGCCMLFHKSSIRAMLSAKSKSQTF